MDRIRMTPPTAASTASPRHSAQHPMAATPSTSCGDSQADKEPGWPGTTSRRANGRKTSTTKSRGAKTWGTNTAGMASRTIRATGPRWPGTRTTTSTFSRARHMATRNTTGTAIRSATTPGRTWASCPTSKALAMPQLHPENGFRPCTGLHLHPVWLIPRGKLYRSGILALRPG